MQAQRWFYPPSPPRIDAPLGRPQAPIAEVRRRQGATPHSRAGSRGDSWLQALASPGRITFRRGRPLDFTVTFCNILSHALYRSRQNHVGRRGPVRNRTRMSGERALARENCSVLFHSVPLPRPLKPSPGLPSVRRSPARPDSGGRRTNIHVQCPPDGIGTSHNPLQGG